MPNIVNVEVSQQVAAAPSTLQRTGAFISQGATTLTPGTVQLLTTENDLAGYLTGSVSINTISWTTGVVTVVTTAPHGIQSGDTIPMIIAGCTPTGYNGTYACTYVNSTTFTYPLAVNPGLIVTKGTTTLEDVQELSAMNNTFFAQGQNLSVYVLELGSGTPADGVASLTTYIANPEVKMYSYLLPKSWDTESTMYDLAVDNNGTTAQLYFYVTTTLATYTTWAGVKSVFTGLQSPSAPITEFSLASMFYVTLNYNPSASNLAHPLSFSFIYGVTPYVLTNTQQTQLKNAGVNWVGTGAEGGISNTIIFWGTFMDLYPFNYWYSVDWLAINVEIALANAIINGSNSPTNPLYYNQNGINTLQKVAQATVNNGIAFGMILSPTNVEAVPFITYVTQRPADYATGTYNGLSVTFVPSRGFTSITIYLTASNIPV
jgi:hypothetical protein